MSAFALFTNVPSQRPLLDDIFTWLPTFNPIYFLVMVSCLSCCSHLIIYWHHEIRTLLPATIRTTVSFKLHLTREKRKNFSYIFRTARSSSRGSVRPSVTLSKKRGRRHSYHSSHNHYTDLTVPQSLCITSRSTAVIQICSNLTLRPHRTV